MTNDSQKAVLITDTLTSAPAHIRLRHVLEINTIGCILVTQSFLPLLRKSRSPRLIFVSSSVGSLPQAADPASRYCESKTGMKLPPFRASRSALKVIVVMGANPGLVATHFLDKGMLERIGMLGADVAARL
ncbi:MAG: hypothetical protein LQ343_007499 [Gyalolechia ehrenbergii]|nr:MAG: hypothetical protein LQ343_007499 [Gyalolechia ehrenbergii]